MLSHNSHSGICTCTGECLQNSTDACNVVTWSQHSLRQRCQVIRGVFWTSTVVNASLQAALDKRNICSRSHPRDLRMRFLFYSCADCLSTCLLGFCQRGSCLMMLQSNSAIDSVRPIPLPDVYFGVYRNPLAQLDARIFSHHPSRPSCSFTGPRSGSWHHMSACSY